MIKKISAKDLLRKMHVVRRVPVMWDSDLAELYGVSTAELLRRVSGCMELPEELMFQVREGEVSDLHVPAQSLSFVFGSGGVGMLCAVFPDDQFVELQVELLRAFVIFDELLGIERAQQEAALHVPLRLNRFPGSWHNPQ